MIELVAAAIIAVLFLAVIFYSSYSQKKRWERITRRKEDSIEKRANDKD